MSTLADLDASVLVRVSWRGGGECSQARGSKSREPVWAIKDFDVYQSMSEAEQKEAIRLAVG